MDNSEIGAAIDRPNGQPVTTTGCAGAAVQREVFQKMNQQNPVGRAIGIKGSHTVCICQEIL